MGRLPASLPVSLLVARLKWNLFNGTSPGENDGLGLWRRRCKRLVLMSRDTTRKGRNALPIRNFWPGRSLISVRAKRPFAQFLRFPRFDDGRMRKRCNDGGQQSQLALLTWQEVDELAVSARADDPHLDATGEPSQRVGRTLGACWGNSNPPSAF
jgi:hypothetical protein